MTKSDSLTPGPGLLRKALAGFTLQGTSLNAWCQANDADYAYARLALLGGRNGPAAVRFREQIAEAAGVLKPNRRVKSAAEILDTGAA